MTKQNGAPRKVSTHFEQVPIDVAKKIANRRTSNAKARTDKAIVKPASRKTQSHVIKSSV